MSAAYGRRSVLSRKPSAASTVTSRRSLPLLGPQFLLLWNEGIEHIFSWGSLSSSWPLQCDYKAQAGASPGTWHWIATVPYTWTRWIWLSFWRTFQKLPGRDFRYKWVTHREPCSTSKEQQHDFRFLTGTWVCQKEAATLSLTLLRASFYTAWASEQGWRRTKHVSSLSELNKYLFCSLTNILMFYSRCPKRKKKS